MEDETTLESNHPEATVPGTGLTIRQWRDMERSVNEAFAETYNRVWVQTTRLGSLCVTMFPIAESENWPLPNYKIFTFKNVRNFSVENVLSLVRSKLQAT